MYDASDELWATGAWSGRPRPRKTDRERLTRHPSAVSALMERLTGAH
jgi:hypothetical protein